RGAQRGVLQAAIHEVPQLADEQAVEIGFAAEESGLAVNHGSRTVGEEGRWIPGRAALVAEEREIPYIFLDMGGKRRFDLQNRAVVKTDLTDRQVFHRVAFVIPIGPLAGDVALFISEISPGIPAGGDRFRSAHG